MKVILEFFQAFFGYVGTLIWWQGLLVIITVMITFLIGKFWRDIVVWIGKRLVPSKNCGDCVVILFSKETKHSSERKKIMGRVLEDQMLFASQKLDSLYLSLIESYRKDQVEFRKDGEDIDYSLEEKEYVLYKETLLNAFDLVKKEIRRSFKENGFHALSGKAFSEYVKNISRHIIDIGKAYMLDKYPDSMTVPIEHRFLKLNIPDIEDIAFDVYINAKDIINNAEAKAEELDRKFVDEIDEFIRKRK